MPVEIRREGLRQQVDFRRCEITRFPEPRKVSAVCRLSIVIPLLGDSQQFEDTLVSVLQNRPDRCEILVVHRGGYEDPYELRDEVNFVQVADNSSALETNNAGIRAARGDIVHLIQPGVLAEEGWVGAAVDRFHDSTIAAVSPLVLDAADRSRIAAAGVRFTPGGRRVVHGAGVRLDRAKRTLRKEIAGPALIAAFYRRSVLDALGGLCPKAGIWHADVDLALSLRRLGFRCPLEPESVMATSDPQLSPPDSFETARCAERVFWRHWRQSAGPLAMLAHGMHITASLFAKPFRADSYAQLFGRALARLERSTYRQHAQRLRLAADACQVADPTDSGDEDGTAMLSLSSYRRHIAA